MKHPKHDDWEDISDILTPDAMQTLEKGQVLLFEQVHLKIMHKTKTRCWAKVIHLYTEEELMDAQSNKFSDVVTREVNKRASKA